MTLFQRIRPSFGEDGVELETRLWPGSRSAGDLLRQRREALGLDLAEIAAALRIKPAYLAALEEGRPDRLPGPAYAAGFVRAYGEHLGLDGGEILRRFRAESGALDAKPDLSFPMPLGERGIPGGSMLLAALILALCGYGAWYYLSSAERSRPE
ncbi:MAG: helix-turn-helix domain-containing protein, partial [Stellaceae bacterium]